MFSLFKLFKETKEAQIEVESSKGINGLREVENQQTMLQEIQTAPGSLDQACTPIGSPQILHHKPNA